LSGGIKKWAKNFKCEHEEPCATTSPQKIVNFALDACIQKVFCVASLMGGDVMGGDVMVSLVQGGTMLCVV